MFYRADDSEWDQLVKFAMRKAEKFVKTAAFEVSVPSWLTGENEVYAPRFLDEIADEIDVLENKKDTLFCKYLNSYAQMFYIAFMLISMECTKGAIMEDVCLYTCNLREK